MSYEGPVDRLTRRRHSGQDFAARARSAQRKASTVRGTDTAGVVTVAVDDAGRVDGVAIAADWRQKLPQLRLGPAVVEAIRSAALQRFTAWGEAIADDAVADEEAPTAEPDFAARLQEAATARLSGAGGRAALEALMDMALALERSIDDVSDRLAAATAATYTGRSADRSVEVTITGQGEITDVRYDRQWLVQAHEINIARLTLAAFRDAYRAVAEQGPEATLANSTIGELQRLTEDPLALARRLGLRD
jgi:DNA-binding protein YbaB